MLLVLKCSHKKKDENKSHGYRFQKGFSRWSPLTKKKYQLSHETYLKKKARKAKYSRVPKQTRDPCLPFFCSESDKK